MFTPLFQTRSITKKILTVTNVKLPKGTEKKAKRVGRGGQLKTAGRGRKGWKARHGKDRQVPAFEGGQSSIIKKFPKLGIQKRGLLNRPSLRPLYLDTLEQWIKLKRLNPEKITIADIAKSGVAGRIKDGVYLLAKGGDSFSTKVDIEVTRASANAIKIIESQGGKVTTVFTDKQRIHSLLNPQKYMTVPEMVLPPNRRLVGMYADESRRGYLAPLVKGVEREMILKTILEKTNLPFMTKPIQ